MIKSLKLDVLAKKYGGEALNARHFFDRVCTDTRVLVPGDLFVALRGDHYDAHDYLQIAIEKGALGLVINKDCGYTLPAEKEIALWLVDNTTLALGFIGNYQRSHFYHPLVAITGSSGKTTVKGMLREIFSESVGNEAVFATKGNFNNHIGVPLSLLSLQAHHKYAVIEMGASGPAEIAYLTEMAKPDVAMVNNVMAAHVEGFGSVDGIAKAKAEIYQGLGKEGVAVVNAGDTYSKQWLLLNRHRKTISFFAVSSDVASKADLYDVYTKDMQLQDNGCYAFCLSCGQQSVIVKLSVMGEHNIANAAAAASCAFALGINIDCIRKGLENFNGESGRLQVLKAVGGNTVIDDTYNANPGSMQAAIDVLATMSGRKIFIMGDMAELGQDSEVEHKNIGQHVARKKIDNFLTFGAESRSAMQAFKVYAAEKSLPISTAKSFKNLDELNESLKKILANDSQESIASKKKYVILVKGSRSSRMERVVNAIKISEDNNNASLAC